MVDRLPPGQRWLDDLVVYDIAPVPSMPTATFQLQITGAVEHPCTLSWSEFMELPQERVTADVHCVTGWSVRDTVWEGVPARAVIELVRPLPGALWVMAHGREGYTTDVPLAYFARSDSLLAHSLNGVPLTEEHGAPLRLIVPSLYAWKSAKYLSRLAFLQRREAGFWEARGYHARGDPWREERFQ